MACFGGESLTSRLNRKGTDGFFPLKKVPDIFPGFEKCIPGNKWNAKGHMHEPGMCQGCAQDLLGVVH